MVPGELEEAQVFDDVASAREVIERVMPNLQDILQFRRIDVHCFATTATKEDCVAAGLPAWESTDEPDESEGPLDLCSEQNYRRGSYH